MNLAQYVQILNTRYQTGISREHSYRGDLQTLLSTLLPDVLITNEPARIAPCACQSGCRVTTTLNRPGSGLNRGGSESQVLRPMMTGQPIVVFFKWAKSSGKCQGMLPLLPITPLRARAKMR